MSDSATSMQHTMPILSIALDQSGSTTERSLAVLDKARDLYIINVRSTYKNTQKLGKARLGIQYSTKPHTFK